MAELDRDKNFAATLNLLDKTNKKSRPQQKAQKTEKLSGTIPVSI